jgi:hypothetical protein
MNLTKEEQSDAANYNAACQKAHENVSEDTNEISRKTFRWVKYITLIVATWFCTVQYDWFLGSILRGNKSGSAMEAKIAKLEIEKQRGEKLNFDTWKIVEEQRVRIINQKRKLNFKEETHQAYLGFLTDRPSYLEHATTCNSDRPNGFPFKEWHPHVVEKLLLFSMDAFHVKALEWVVKQPEWYSIVNKPLVNKINLFLKDYAIANSGDKEDQQKVKAQ